MTHEELRDRLGAYLDGELDDARRAELEVHLEACDSCRGELAALRALDGALAKQPVPDPGSAYWERFADRITERIQPRPAGEPARLYERLTGWLFPRGRFAWARAAVAVATCTLLVTVGLHGFKTAEVAVRRPLAPVAPVQPPGEVAEPGIPPSSNTEPQEVPGDSRVPSSERDRPATQEREKRDLSSRTVEAAPRAQEGKPLAPGVEIPPGASWGMPEEKAGAGRVDTDAVPAPPAPADERLRKTAKIRGGRTVLEDQPAPEAQLAPGARRAPASPSRLEERETAGSAPPPKDEAGAARLPSKPSPVLALPQSSEPSVAAPMSKLLGKESITDEAVSTNAAIEIAKPQPVTASAEVDSLLAREARLWPHREDAERRPQLEALAQDLVTHADDVRARKRAREILNYLAETSPSTADSEHWQNMLRSLPEP